MRKITALLDDKLELIDSSSFIMRLDQKMHFKLEDEEGIITIIVSFKEDINKQTMQLENMGNNTANCIISYSKNFKGGVTNEPTEVGLMSKRKLSASFRWKIEGTDFKTVLLNINWFLDKES